MWKSQLYSICEYKKQCLPQHINKIGERLFKGCNALSDVHIQAEDPNAISVEFEEEDVKNITLYVPIGTGYAYRHHPEFGKFKEIKIE